MIASVGEEEQPSGTISVSTSGTRDAMSEQAVEERVICFGAFPMDESHPRGTLAIVSVLGAFFALGWLAMFLFLFLERGAPQP